MGLFPFQKKFLDTVSNSSGILKKIIAKYSSLKAIAGCSAFPSWCLCLPSTRHCNTNFCGVTPYPIIAGIQKKVQSTPPKKK